MPSLLPPNSTHTELAIEAVTARIGDVPVPLRTLWDSRTCPAELLPWLAWALGVDQWEPDWTLEQKRNTVDAAIRVHRHKGTPGAMKTAVAALGYTLDLVQWFDTNGAHPPGTFGIDITLDGNQSIQRARDLLDVIQHTKNERSHFWGISYQYDVRGDVNVCAAQSYGLELLLLPKQPPRTGEADYVAMTGHVLPTDGVISRAFQLQNINIPAQRYEPQYQPASDFDSPAYVGDDRVAMTGAIGLAAPTLARKYEVRNINTSTQKYIPTYQPASDFDSPAYVGDDRVEMTGDVLPTNTTLKEVR